MRFYGIRQYIRIGDEVGELCVAATAENGGRLLTDLSVEHGWEEGGTEQSDKNKCGGLCARPEA